MRWVFVLVGAGVLAYLLWPDESPSRSTERGSAAERAAPRIEPPEEQSDVFDRVAKGFAELKEAELRTLRGKVSGPDGEPVAEAQIRIFDAKPIATNSRGEFAFAWPSDTEKVDLLVKHHAYLDATAVRTRADGFDFVLQRGLSVSGRVSFLDGFPLPRWKVGAGMPRGEQSWGWTDEEGRFSLSGLEPGPVQVSTRVGSAYMTMLHEAGTADVRFEIRQSILRLTLRHPDGGPVHDAQAWVQVGVRKQRAFENLAAVPPGSEVLLTIAAPGLRSIRRTIPAWSSRPALHEETVEFELAGSAKVLLDVWKAGGKRPYKLHVKVIGTERNHMFEDVGAQPIELGGFEPGVVRLRVHADTQARLVRILDLTAVEKEPVPVRVDLPAGTMVAVNWPGDGTAVRLWPYGSKFFYELTKVGDEYRTSFDVPVGIYTLTGHVGARQVREEEVSLVAGEIQRFDWS